MVPLLFRDIFKLKVEAQSETLSICSTLLTANDTPELTCKPIAVQQSFYDAVSTLGLPEPASLLPRLLCPTVQDIRPSAGLALASQLQAPALQVLASSLCSSPAVANHYISSGLVSNLTSWSDDDGPNLQGTCLPSGIYDMYSDP